MTHYAFKLRAYFYVTFILGLTFITLISPASLFAQQTAASDTLAEIKITASKYLVEPMYQPVQLLSIDQKMLRSTGATDLANLLSLVGHAYIRSYGPGLSAGISQRGFTTSSFQIIRDGFVLNNPMLGQVDMALIPLELISSAEGASANASTAYGSSALGGSLVLNSEWTPSISLSQTIGSFGYQKTALSAGDQYGNTRLTLQLGRKTADNNFSYYDPTTQTVKKRLNNNQNNQWLRIGTSGLWFDHFIQTNLIVIQAKREIPDAVVFSPANALQNDSEIRFTGIISPNQSKKWTTYIEAYQSNIRYNDIYLSDPSRNKIQSASIRSNLHILDSSVFNLYLDNGFSYSGIHSNNIEGIKSRNTFNTSVQGKISASKLQVYPSIRFDWISDVDYALSYSTGVNFALIPDKLHLRSQLSRNFTVPTLNDLYWVYGGNPELLPETSVKADLGYHLQINGAEHSVDWQVQVYRAHLDNGIVWRPKDQFQWSPINIQQISSTGLEQSLKWTYTSGSFSTDLRTQITYTIAEVSKSRFDGDVAVGKQLPYTPVWMLRFQPGIAYRKTELFIEYTHDSKRYITEDHSSPIDPFDGYSLFNTSLIQEIKLGRLQYLIKINVNNIFDKKYNIINYYPQPGRNTMASLIIKY
jgi:iron complex outermembrane receptor protein